MNATITKKFAALVAKNKITPEVQKELDNAAKSVKNKDPIIREYLICNEVQSKAGRIYLISKMNSEKNKLAFMRSIGIETRTASEIKESKKRIAFLNADKLPKHLEIEERKMWNDPGFMNLSPIHALD